MKEYLKSYFWIVKLQRKTSTSYFIWGLFNSISMGLFPILQTYALAKLISSVSSTALSNADTRPVYIWLLVLLAAEILRGLLRSADNIARNRYQQKVEIVSNEQLLNKMYELNQEQFDNEEFNTKLSRATDGLRQMWRVTDQIYWVTSDLIGFIGSLIAIIAVAPYVGLIIIISIIPGAIVQIRQNKIRDAMYRELDPLERVASYSSWMLLNPNFMLEVRLMNAFKSLVESWKNSLKKTHQITYEVDKKMAKMDVGIGILQPLVGFGANVYYFRILLESGITLDRFLFLRSMLEQANSSVSSIVFSVKRIHEIFISLKNFTEVFNTPPAIPNGQIEVSRPLTIEFKNVSFKYPGTDREVLKNISFVMFPGSKLAVVGENGAGKTTLIKLLLRQYLPSSGEILINGENIKNIKQETYYYLISNLSQRYLMVNHLSIRDNLSLGLEKSITDKKISEALDYVGIKDFVKKLSKGLDTRMDPSFEDGTSLSGGQEQRLAVARALLRNGDMMILDEPTSAIDARAEYTIFNNIYKAHQGKTTLIVSHRFSTVRKADKIIVMDNGCITEYGSHEELIKHNGLYKEMFETQAEGYR